MSSYIENYSKNNYCFETTSSSFYQSVMDQLNTPLGSRAYYPDYGSKLYLYKFLPLDINTAKVIHAEIYILLSSYEGVDILSTDYKLLVEQKTLRTFFDLNVTGDFFTISFNYATGEVKNAV